MAFSGQAGRRLRPARIGALVATTTLALAPLLGGSPAPAAAAAAETNCVPGANQIALFVGRNYSGECVRFDVGAHPTVSGIPDNSVSSVRSGANVTAVVHQDAEFGGADNHSWQALGANDKNLGDNTYHDLESAPDNGGKVEDSISALWVMRRGCVPGATEVSIFQSSGYGGACANVPAGAYASAVQGGVPVDFAGSIKVGSSVRASAWAEVDFAGPTCSYNPGVRRSSICFGNNKLSSLMIGSDSTPPSIAVTHVADGQNGWNLAGPVPLSIVVGDSGSGLPDPPTCTDAGAALAVTGPGPQYTAPVSGPGIHEVTCAIEDSLGNRATASDTVKIDHGPPSVEATVTAGGEPYTPGAWTNDDVVVTFECTDAGSGVAAVTPPVTVTTEGADHSVTGTCTDAAGHTATRTVDSIQLDKSAPMLDAQREPEAGPGGWDTAEVTVTFACDDPLSGVASLTDPVTVSSDGANQSATGTCVDGAGNEASVTVDGINIDRESPTLSVAAAVDGQPYDAGTWTSGDVFVTFECTDAGSGVASVTPPTTVTAEGANQSVTGTCTDNAGRSATRTFDDIDIDRTPPSISATATADGEPYQPGTWSAHDVVVSFACDDAVSGVASVTDPITISSEGADQSATGTCVDEAGNEAATTVTDIDIDRNGPSLSAAATVGGEPYEAGTWTNGDVVVTFTCTDAGGGVGSVTPPVTVTTEGADQSVDGTCTDDAGRTTNTTFDDIDIDKTAPTLTVSATVDGEPYEAGTWAGHDVVVSFDCDDARSGVATVTDPITVSTDGADQSVDGSCTDRAGNQATAAATNIDIDQDDPVLSAAATAGGDAYEAGTWTNVEVIVTFTCTDAGSGVASVTPPTTVTAQGANQSVTGTCTDNAGRSTTRTFDDIDIDRTAPSISATATADGEPYEPGTWSGHDVRVTFDCTDALAGVVSVTDPVTISSEGADQSATGTCVDGAGNEATAAVTDIDVDKDDPTLSVSATAGGVAYQPGSWARTNVVVTFTCTDAGSGVASVTPPVTVTDDGDDQSVTGTCTDHAGRSSEATMADIAIDRTPPTVAYTGNAGTYTYGDPISIDCTASDALSGVVEDTCADITGPLDVGTHTFTATARDRAGNTATASTTVTVEPRPVESLGSGDWSDPAAWSSGEPPGPTDIVTVAAGHTIALDAAAASVRGLTIEADAALVFAPELTITLESSRNVVVEGTLTMRPASPAYVHLLRFVGIDERDFQGGGDVIVDSDTGLWVVDAGKLDAVGSAKTSWTRANATVAAGATSITLEEAPAGWAPGDEISIAPTEHPGVGSASWNGFDLRTVAAVSGNTVTLNAGTSREHPMVNGAWGAEVMNLTRNVRIEGTPTGRTHVMITAGVPQTITNVALRHTGPRQPQGNFTRFVLGRYGLHFHMGHNGTRGSVVDGVVVRDSGSHAFVPHMSHGITFRNTISYDTFEEAYWWDDFTITNDALYDHTIAALVRSDPSWRGYRLSGYELTRGNGNTVRDSVAVGVQGSTDASGFTWPESANAEPNTWEFTDNVSHNNRVDGIFVWQNTGGRHDVGPFVAFHNGQYGIDHGAYGNPYQYHDGILFENAAGGIKQRALSQGNIGNLGFSGITIIGGAVAVHLAEHNRSDTVPTVYRDCAYTGQSGPKIRVQESMNPGRYDFINCDLDPADFQIVSAVPGMRIRVQRTDRSAFQIGGDGAVTVIPRFEPPDIPPTVSLTSPESSATFTEPASVTLTADAADADGTVAQVEFFAGSTSLGVVTDAPYTFTWENVLAGDYTIVAVATDNDTAKTFSTPVAISVDPP
jgi:Bacterial Ig domain/G8 domain